MPFRTASFALPFALLVLASHGLAAEMQAGEYEVKAALLYNFARFIDWPGRKSGDFRLCIVGRDPFGPELDALAGKPVRERPIRIERQPVQWHDCQLIFVAANGPLPASWPGVLLVAEESASSQGAAIVLGEEGKRVFFAIDQEAASRADLKISYKLLRLARSLR